MVEAIHELVDSDKVQFGVVVHLATVLLPFLLEAPLVESEWLNCAAGNIPSEGAMLAA